MSKKTNDSNVLSFWKPFIAWVNGDERPEREASHKPVQPQEAQPAKVHHTHAKKVKRFSAFYRVFAVIVALALIAVMLLCVASLPLFGHPENPTNNEVPARYIEKGVEETGAINVVASMILDYRAFDTFGESAVLFLAVISVLILLLKDQNNMSLQSPPEAALEEAIAKREEDMILRQVATILVPCILLYGIYVVLNGHLSPGGGFSGGTIMGAGLILFSAAYGFQAVHSFFNFKTFTALSCGALLVYASSKAYSFFTGANHIHSIIPLGTPGNILSSGLILVLNICVGLIVCCTMYGFYALFTKGEM